MIRELKKNRKQNGKRLSAGTQISYHAMWKKSAFACDACKERKTQLDREKLSFIIRRAMFRSWEKVHAVRQQSNFFFFSPKAKVTK